MKTTRFILVGLLGGLLGLATGCGKSEQQSPTPPVAPPAEKKTGAVAPEIQKAADAAKTTASQAVQAATGESAKAQGLIDTAKKLVADGKWQEVGATLAQLKDIKLTPDQESALLELKKKLETMLQESLGKKPVDAGGLLPK